MYQGIVLCLVILVAAFKVQKTFCLFDASLTQLEPFFLNDTKYVNLKDLGIKKVNRTHMIIGSFETFQDFNNDFEFVAYLNKKTGNQYRRLPFKVGPKPFCQFFDDGKIFIPELRKVSNIPAKGVCPLKKDVYKIYGYEVKMDKAPTIFESGQYMAELQLMKDGVILNGIRLHGNVVYVQT